MIKMGREKIPVKRKMPASAEWGRGTLTITGNSNRICAREHEICTAIMEYLFRLPAGFFHVSGFFFWLICEFFF